METKAEIYKDVIALVSKRVVLGDWWIQMKFGYLDKRSKKALIKIREELKRIDL